MRPITRLMILVTGVVLVAACGGGSTTGAAATDHPATDDAASADAATADAAPDHPATDDTAASAAATAERNIGLLQSSDDVHLIEVLDVGDGSITTLDSAIDGDRPVLLWFWAPH